MITADDIERFASEEVAAFAFMDGYAPDVDMAHIHRYVKEAVEAVADDSVEIEGTMLFFFVFGFRMAREFPKGGDNLQEPGLVSQRKEPLLDEAGTHRSSPFRPADGADSPS